MTATPTILLHAHGVEYTTTPNGIYVVAPEQQVQARPFQPLSDWPQLPALRVFWPWPLLRQIWAIEDKAARAERRRSAAKRRGIVLMIEGQPAAQITPCWPEDVNLTMLAWRQRIRERAMADEPVRIEYGPAASGVGYSVRLVGAWTFLPRTDLVLPRDATALGDHEGAHAVALRIEQRLRRSGRHPVILEVGPD